MRVLLVSTYEMGHQPLCLASAAAALRARGHDVRCLDLAVGPVETDAFLATGLVAISVPMHTASRLGIELARRVRRLRPEVPIAFYGLYATPLYERLTGSGLADAVIGGEYEIGLGALADALAGGRRPSGLAGVGAVPLFDRQSYPVPDRAGLPALDQYARLSLDGDLRLAGYVEASRGCAHTCAHCPITPVYGGRLRLVQKETVLADVDQLVAMGARHITFGDPDFLNAVPHSLAIVEEMRDRHPDLTFDATIKVEHLIEHADLLPRLRDLGCVFITSAFESTNDAMLGLLEKGHTRADLDRVLETARREAIVLRPTWVAFTPWTRVEDYAEMLSFIEEKGLVGHVQPVQYGLRLLLPPGSPLINTVRSHGRLGPFDDERLTYTWANPDERIDALQAEVSVIVERSLHREDCDDAEPYAKTFAKVKRAALRALTGRDTPVTIAAQPQKRVPGLTEAWFC